MVVSGGLGHGCYGEEGAAVSCQGLTQDVLSPIDLGASQVLKLGQVHLHQQQRKGGERGEREREKCNIYNLYDCQLQGGESETEHHFNLRFQ